MTVFLCFQLRKNPDDGIQYLLPKSEIFDALWDAHLSTGHGGEKKMRFFIADKYDNVTQKMIAAFVSNCETCQKKKTRPNKGLVVRPLQTKNILERGQVDLIVMESAPDRGFKYILNYQDHFSKFLFLRPMKTKTAAETAYNLIDIFCMITPPTVLQSDNGREFTAHVIMEMVEIWPGLSIVHGSPRHPQSQGSVERSNADVKQMLTAWSIDNDTTKWAEGLRFVQLQKNSSPHRNLNNRTPLEVFCGRKKTSGLERTCLPKEVIARLEKEEDLLEVLSRMQVAGGQRVESEADGDENDEAAPEETIRVEAADDNDDLSENENAVEARTEKELRPKNSVGNESEIEGYFGEATTSSTALEELSPQNSTENDAEVEGADGGAATFRTALEDHASILTQCRQDAREGQEKSRAEMLRTTRSKMVPLMENDGVLVPVSEFDRGRLDCRNVPGVVLKVHNDMYQVGTKHGIINTMLSRNQIIEANFQMVTADQVKDTVLPMRSIAQLHSRHGGQGFKKCSCNGKCGTARCTCKKAGNHCHTHCHPNNSSCKNKSK